MNKALYQYIDYFVIVYIDDILIYLENEDEHEEHVIKVLQALQDTYLRVKLEKSEFYIDKVEFLEYNIEPGQIRISRKKVDTIII